MRADIGRDKKNLFIDVNVLGGNNHEQEKVLKQDIKRVKWTEPHMAKQVIHVCPVCNDVFKGRSNRIYCTDVCKHKANLRTYRRKVREYMNFKPHRGTVGEIYIMCTHNGNDIISFVPAYYADTRERAEKYIEDTYAEEVRDNYMEQVKEVLKK